MGVGIVGCHGRKSNDIQSNSDLNIYTKKNQIMKLASRSYSVLALMVVAVSVLFEVTVANPLPQSEDDYGDFDVSKLDRQAKLEDDTAEVAKIGVKAIGAAPSILEQKIAFAQGFGKTVEETSGQVKQVVTVLPDLLPNSRQIDAAAKLAQ